jgi:lipid-binding SYLF domain-containing protein
LRIIISSNVNGNGSNFVKFGTMKYTAGYQPRIHIVPVGTAAAGATAEVSAAGRIFAYLNFR